MSLFIIEATLSEPIVTYGDGLHLDGPLAYAMFMSLPLSERAKVPPIESDWAEDFDLPLDRWESECKLPQTVDPRLTIDGKLTETGNGYRGIVWGWKCSAAIPVGQVLHAQHSLRKKPAIEQMVRYGGDNRYNVGSGPHKARDLIYPMVHVRALSWHCCGDADKTVALLSRYVSSIGKLSRQGPGRVLRWEARPVDYDWSLRGDDGRPMRQLPSLMFPNLQALNGTIRTPYYHRSRWASTVAPEAWQ